MFRLLIICLATSAYAVSSPEIATKSGKSPSSSNQSTTGHKTPPKHDEPLLNSINAYAQQYESATPTKAYSLTPIYSQPYNPPTNFNLATSPQLPTSPALEHNFQPMPSPQHFLHHHHQKQQQTQFVAQQNPSTPVIMQYLPQSQINDGVQYLQLIPTRPLIVPISPYMSPMSHAQAYQSPPQIISQQHLNDFAGRSLLAATEPDHANSIPYGLNAYAPGLQNYRGYRFNRETKPSDSPLEMSLNINEYMPVPNDAPKPSMIRGRP